MKKIFLAVAVAAVALTSCTTQTSTSKVMDIPTTIESHNAVDLVVSDKRISYTLQTTPEIRRGGVRNVYRTAVSEALKANGHADILVNPQYEVTSWRGLIRKKITSVTVSGHPATYKNSRPASKPCKK